VAFFFSGGCRRISSIVSPVSRPRPWKSRHSAYIIMAKVGSDSPSRLTQCIFASSPLKASVPGGLLMMARANP